MLIKSYKQFILKAEVNQLLVKISAKVFYSSFYSLTLEATHKEIFDKNMFWMLILG